MNALLLPLLLACAGGDPAGGDTGSPGAGDGGSSSIQEPPGEAVASSLSRDTDPDVDDATLRAHTTSMRAASMDLFGELGEAGGVRENLFLSPYSISVALAMTYAGARGDTAAQMADALHFDLPDDQLHPAFNALDLTLSARPDEVGPDDGDPFQLSIVNQLFGQLGYPFEDPFLDTLALNYGAGLRLLDFATDPDGNRILINDWVESVTEDRIEDLLPDGSITDHTKLVLVNAIYFKASWSAPFEAADTTTDVFSRLDGSTTNVPTMHGVQETLYGTGDGFAVVDVPYVGHDLVMTVLVPDAGSFDSVVSGLDGATLDAALADMDGYEVTLAVPKFGFKSQLDLVAPLQGLGMTDAFSESLADFSGMSTQSLLFITGVFHQAFVDVNEEGTEAAAATAVVVGDESAPERVELTVDRPFLFMIRDRPTGAVLFLGQVVDPGT